jgi:hypothetical protein
MTDQGIIGVGKIQLVKVQDQKTAGRVVSNPGESVFSVGDMVRKRQN